MTLGIPSDSLSLAVQRSLRGARSQATSSQAELASGTRIQRASDDAAGLSVSSRMQAELRGLNQALRNTNDLFSLLLIADGALAEQEDLLQEMRELSVQAANDTLTLSDRMTIVNRGLAIRDELDRITEITSFNGTNLLDGTFSSRAFDLDGSGSGELFQISLQGADSIDLRAQRVGPSTLQFENFRSTANATASMEVNGVFVTWESADAADQAGNASALHAALSEAATAAALSAQDISVGLSNGGTAVQLTRADGRPIAVTNFDPGGPSEVVDTTFASAVSGYLSVNRQGLAAATRLDGGGGPLASFSAGVTVVEATPNVGTSSVTGTSLPQSVRAVESDGSGLTSGSLLEGFIGSNLEADDTVDLAFTDNGGASTTLTYTFAGSDTVQDLIDFVNGAGAGYTASLSGGRLRIEETTPALGSSLALSIQNYVDADTFGVPATFTGETYADSGEPLAVRGSTTGLTLVSTLEGWVGTNLEVGDTFDVDLTRNDGTAATVTYTVAGGDTVTSLRNAVNAAGVGFTASLDGGRFRLRETSPTAGTSLAASLSNFVDVNPGSLAGSLGAETFSDTGEALAVSSGTGGLTTGTALTSWLGSNFEALDTFDITLTRNDGTILAPITYTFAGGDTVQDVLDAINGAGVGFTAAVSGGQMRIAESAPTDGAFLAATFGNFVDEDPLSVAGSFSSPTMGRTDRRLTSSAQLTAGGGVTAGTLINTLDQFDGIQGGDTLAIIVTDEAGTDRSFTYSFAGAVDALTTSTVGDLVTAIDAQAGVSAAFDVAWGIVVTDDAGPGAGNLAVSYTPGDFTEYVTAADNANATVAGAFAFSAAGVEQRTGALTDGGVAATLATSLNALDGFSDLQVGDVLRFSLTNYAGVSQTFDLTLNDVAQGLSSNRTVGDVVSFLDGQAVGSSTFNATLSAAGEIVVTETSADRRLGSGFDVGDTFDIVLGDSSGATTTLSYTFGTATDTWGDVINYIGANSAFTASFQAGRLAITEDTLSGTSAVSVAFNNYQNAGGAAAVFNGAAFGAQSARAYSGFMNPAPLTAATQLNDLVEFDAVHSGDIARFVLTDGAGATQNVDYTFVGGSVGDLATDTVGDLVAALDAVDPTLRVYFEASVGQIAVEEVGVPTGLSVGLSFAQSDFQDLAGPVVVHEMMMTADSRSFGTANLQTGTTEATVQAYAYDLSSQDGARVGMVTLDEAIRRHTLTRAEVGALLNRVEQRASILSARGISVASSRSNHHDTDIAGAAAQLASAVVAESAATSTMRALRVHERRGLELLRDTLAGL